MKLFSMFKRQRTNRGQIRRKQSYRRPLGVEAIERRLLLSYTGGTLPYNPDPSTGGEAAVEYQVSRGADCVQSNDQTHCGEAESQSGGSGGGGGGGGSGGSGGGSGGGASVTYTNFNCYNSWDNKDGNYGYPDCGTDGGPPLGDLARRLVFESLQTGYYPETAR